MIFKASKEYVCDKCGQKIRVGDGYNWSRNVPAGGVRQNWHEPCCPPKLSSAVPSAVPSEKTKQPEEKMQAEKSSAVPSDVSSKEKALADALRQFIPEKQLDEARVLEIFKEAIKGVTFQSRELTVTVGEAPKVNVGLAHKQFEKLMKIACMKKSDGMRHNIWLYGDAGSGKSHGAHQLAKALNLPYQYASLCPMTSEGKLFGFVDAQGRPVETKFYELYTKGGVFCLDEFDNSSSSLTVMLNSLVENGHGAFPHGTFKRHPDFYLIVTGNTIGRGGDVRYPERRALDSSSLDRFIFVEWDYDFGLVETIVGGILQKGADEVRQFIAKIDAIKREIQARYPAHVVSPRAYYQSAELTVAGFDWNFIQNAVIWRGVKH